MSYENDETVDESLVELEEAPQDPVSVCAECGEHRQVESTRVRRRRPSIAVLACGHREEL